MSVNEILEQVRILTPEEREELLRQLLIMHGSPSKTHDILEFEGIAAHLADDEDPQAMVNRLRDEWDNRS